jgi:type II secretory pathway pseudopilin PulG
MNAQTMGSRERSQRDEGFGLAEIVVAMLLLAIIAAAFLPVLATTVVQSARNVTLTTATQMVNDQLERARGQAATCAALQAYAGETVLDIVDSRAVPLRTTRTVGACPSTYPGTISVTATVTRTDGSGPTVVASAKTLIYLEKAL